MRVNPYLPLGLAVAFVSLGSILVRAAQAPPLTVSFYRVFLASVLLAPFALPALVGSWPRLATRHRVLLLGCGVALALHFATWIASLSYTSIASSVLIVNTAPLFTLAFSRWFLRESVPRVVVWATAVALAGAGLLAFGDWTIGPASLSGDALSLAGAVTLSVYHVIGRGLRAAIPLNAYVLGVWSTAAATLGLIALGFRAPLLGHSPRALGAFLGLAVVPTLGGHGLVNLSLRALPAPTVGLFLLGEPVGATILAYLIFGEAPGPWTLAGGALVLAGLSLVVLAKKR